MEADREASGRPEDQQTLREPGPCHASALSLSGMAVPEMLGSDFHLRVGERRQGRGYQPSVASVWVLNGFKGNRFDLCPGKKGDSQGLQSVARSTPSLSSSPDR